MPEPRVGYVLKVYPRFSETFVLEELLAHERAGLELEVFSLRPPTDGRFHEALARLRAPVTYLGGDAVKADALWAELEGAQAELPGLGLDLAVARGEVARDVHAAARLARAVHARAITHLHAHFATSATAVARMAAAWAGVPYSFTAHAKDIFHDEVRPDDLRRKLAEAAATVTVSDFNLRHLRGTFGFDAARTRRVYNGLPLARYPYASPYERPPEIVGVGRLVEKKGFADLVDACALLAGDGRDFSCRIVGAGAGEAALRDRVAAHGLGERVALVGPRPQEEVKAIVGGAAAFAAPCLIGGDGNRDGLPTVLLEAMALGTPCVSTDVTGIPEVLRDGETGLAVPQRDPAALAAALGRLLDDGAERERLAASARARVEADFDIDVNTQALRDVLGVQTPRPALSVVGG